MNKILMTALAENWEPVTEGMAIPITKERSLKDIRDSQHGFYCYVQHDCFLDSPTYGKLLMRDTRYGGALKAFIKKFQPGVMPKELKVLRLSQSGKSLIVEAIY